MPGPISISGVRSAIKRTQEALPFGPDYREEQAREVIELHVVETTSFTLTSGRYPGVRYDYDADADSYTSSEVVWVDTPLSAQILHKEVKYWCKFVGTRSSDGIAIYTAVSPPEKLRGKLDSQLTVGSSVTMSIWEYSGSESDTGQDVTVYDWMLATGQTIASGKKVTAFFDTNSNRWYVDAAECA